MQTMWQRITTTYLHLQAGPSQRLLPIWTCSSRSTCSLTGDTSRLSARQAPGRPHLCSVSHLDLPASEIPGQKQAAQHLPTALLRDKVPAWQSSPVIPGVSDGKKCWMICLKQRPSRRPALTGLRPLSPPPPPPPPQTLASKDTPTMLVIRPSESLVAADAPNEFRKLSRFCDLQYMVSRDTENGLSESGLWLWTLCWEASSMWHVFCLHL